jgi:hypothetical protein
MPANLQTQLSATKSKTHLVPACVVFSQFVPAKLMLSSQTSCPGNGRVVDHAAAKLLAVWVLPLIALTFFGLGLSVKTSGASLQQAKFTVYHYVLVLLSIS